MSSAVSVMAQGDPVVTVEELAPIRNCFAAAGVTVITPLVAASGE